jgi:hypothetical protein
LDNGHGRFRIGGSRDKELDPNCRSEFLRVDDRVKQVNHYRDQQYKEGVNRHSGRSSLAGFNYCRGRIIPSAKRTKATKKAKNAIKSRSIKTVIAAVLPSLFEIADLLQRRPRFNRTLNYADLIIQDLDRVLLKEVGLKFDVFFRLAAKRRSA